MFFLFQFLPQNDVVTSTPKVQGSNLGTNADVADRLGQVSGPQVSPVLKLRSKEVKDNATHSSQTTASTSNKIDDTPTTSR